VPKPRNARSRRSGGTAARKSVKTPPSAADNAHSGLVSPDDVADIRRLIRLVQHTGIGELEVSSGGRSVRISAFGAAPMTAPAGFAPSALAPERSAAAPPVAAPAESPAPSKTVAITSPMVGSFYRAPAPDADPYVEVGTPVEVGQTVCIVEAMKLMNEIESEVRGTIVKVLVENAQPVEYGQALFLVEPA
jgi:oxaloacetate decarboxylase alpha subunit